MVVTTLGVARLRFGHRSDYLAVAETNFNARSPPSAGNLNFRGWYECGSEGGRGESYPFSPSTRSRYQHLGNSDKQPESPPTPRYLTVKGHWVLEHPSLRRVELRPSP